MNYVIVPESQRRANKRAISERDRWRRQYATVSRAIQRSKGRLRSAHKQGSFELEHGELVTLNALRVQADLLMLFRADISIELRDTAYRYAPRELLAA